MRKYYFPLLVIGIILFAAVVILPRYIALPEWLTGVGMAVSLIILLIGSLLRLREMKENEKKRNRGEF